jgi:hypothetical protein
MGFGVSIFFFLSDTWELQAQKFQLFNLIGSIWMQIRPNLGLTPLHPNDIAGVADLALPFAIALTLEFRRRKLVLEGLLFGLMAFLIFVTVILSASRGAWMAIGITAGWYLGNFGWISQSEIPHRQFSPWC